jgi:hypothetical protein
VKFALHTPAGERVFLTDHAIARYRERLREHLQTPEQIHADARRLVACCGVIQTAAPEWANPEAREADAWLVCGDVAFVLGSDRARNRYVALTTVTRGGISDEARRTRNAKRSARSYARRKRNGLPDVRPRPELALEAE